MNTIVNQMAFLNSKHLKRLQTRTKAVVTFVSGKDKTKFYIHIYRNKNEMK